MTEPQDNLAGIIKFHLNSSEGRIEVDAFQNTSELDKPSGKEKEDEFPGIK